MPALLLGVAWAGLFGLLASCGHDGTPESGDFSVLARADDRFEQARPGVPLAFPRDHGPHPGYRIEWWYVTANLEDEAGRPWGLQWTLFRTAMGPVEGTDGDSGTPGWTPNNPWQDGQVYMAHFAVSAPGGHRAFQRYARGGDFDGVRQAGARSDPFAAWLDDWRLESTGEDWLPLRLVAAQDDVEASLALSSDRPPVLQGEGGYSQKHPAGGGSYYYSQPWLEATGRLRVGGETVSVHGHAWLDREWSSQFLQPDQAGWDWFALHLDGGNKLMAFQLRSDSDEPYLHAVLLDAAGGRRSAGPGELSLSPTRHGRVAGRRLPVGWRLDWPAADLALDIEARQDAQWMDVDFPYWEGQVAVRDREGRTVGVGYLEMTGYGAGGDRGP